MHGKKSGPGIAVARGEFGELTRGELTRFYCIAWTVQVLKVHLRLIRGSDLYASIYGS